MPSYVVITDNTGAALGEGPIYRATRWVAASRLDRTARCSFEVPAADPRAHDLLQNKRQAHYYAVMGDGPQEVGALIIDQIETVVEGRAEPMLRVSGDNLLADLATRSVHGLELYDVETVTATAVSHVWRYGDGSTYYSDLMAEAYDGDGGTVYQIDIGLKDWNHLYVAGATPLSAATLTLTGTSTAASGTITVQYYNGDGWYDAVITSDGTHDGTRTLGQSGKIEWNRPADQVMTTHDGVEAYWVRLQPTVSTTDGLYISEVDVDQDCETLTGLADIMAYAPAGWTVSTANGGYATTKNGAYMQFAGETVLEALTMLAEHTGEHFRLGVGKSIDWLQDDPREAPVDSGVYAVGPAGAADSGNLDACYITELEEMRDSYQQISRIYAKGAGVGNAQVTLAGCTVTPEAGYSIDYDEIQGLRYYYLAHDATEASLGRVEAVRTWPEAGQMEADSAHAELAANALYQVAYEYLKRHITPQYGYTLRVGHLEREVWPGETVRVTYRRHRDGERYIDIDGAMVVLGVEMAEDSGGIRATALEIASTDAWPLEAGEFVVRELRNARRRHAGNGGVSVIGGGGSVETLEDMALNSVLLAQQTNPYPVVYSGDAVGLTAALATAAAGDSVWLPTGGIYGDFTVPAGVMMRGRGFSWIAGTVTLGDGAQGWAWGITHSVDQAGTLYGIIGPESGDCALNNCWINVANATGDAAAILAQGGEIELYRTYIKGTSTSGTGYAVYGECDNVSFRQCPTAEAESGGADSNPFGAGGGDWPDALFAATKSAGIYYTEDSLAPAAADPVWAALNDGLASLEVRALCLDPANPTGRQWCLTSDGTIYRRTTGAWASVLDTAAARTLTSHVDGQVFALCVDHVTGTLYAVFNVTGAAATNQYCLRSTDGGDNWTAHAYVSGNCRMVGKIDAYNGVVAIGVQQYTYQNRIYLSQDSGATWGVYTVSDMDTIVETWTRLHPGDPAVVYGNVFNVGASYGLGRWTIPGGVQTTLRAGAELCYSPGGVWFDPDDADHMLSLAGQYGTPYETLDSWATLEATAGTLDVQEVLGNSPYGRWVLGKVASGTGCVGVSTDLATLTDKTGANNTSAPYTDSIPDTCGGICDRGLQAVYGSGSATPYVYSCEIPNADGRADAIPLYGDRASWRTDVDDGATHADDWASGDSHHAAMTLGAGADALLSLSGQELGITSGAATSGQVPVADGAGGVAWQSVAAHVHVYQEDHSAECDGAETTFATAQGFELGTTRVWLNGLLQQPGAGNDYTENGNGGGVTFATAPQSGDVLLLAYIVEAGSVSGPYTSLAGTESLHTVQLHCHTTESDGALSPAALMAAYEDAGFDAVMISDHDTVTADPGGHSIVHFEGNELSPTSGHILSLLCTYTRGTETDSQTLIDEVIAAGGLPVLAHPNWNAHHTYAEMAALTDYTGIEIHNAHVVDGAGENPITEGGFEIADWDALLTNVRRDVWGFSTDDFHADGATDRPGAGRVRVFAAELTAEAVQAALEAGNFVADVSNDGVTPGIPAISPSRIAVTCSGATAIRFVGDSGTLLEEDSGEAGEYTLAGTEGYVRIEAVGQYAEGFASSLPAAWYSSAGIWAVSGGVLQQQQDTAGPQLIYLRRHRHGDLDLTCDMRCTTTSRLGPEQAGIAFNVLGATHHYLVCFAPQVDTLELFKATGGAYSSIRQVAKTTDFDTWYTVRVRYTQASGLIQCRLWATSGAEPGTWDIEETDTSLQVGGMFALRTRYLAEYDNLTIDGFKTYYQPIPVGDWT